MRFALGFALLVACSNETPSLDAAAAGAPRKHIGSVEVTVYGMSTSTVANASVAFVDPDGHGEVVLTQADGIARGQLVVGGSVTAVIPIDTGPTAATLSTALDVQDGDHITLGYRATAQPLPPSGTPACASDVTLVGTFTHVDPEITHITLSRTIAETSGAIVNSTTVTPTTELSVTGAPGVRAIVSATFVGPAGDRQMPSRQYIVESIDGCATEWKVDVRRNMLPWISPPSLDTSTGIVHVPVSGQGGGDLMRVNLSYGSTSRYVHWDIAGPHAGDVFLPSLPGELAAHLPQPDDKLSFGSVELLDIDEIHGYDHAREKFQSPDSADWYFERLRNSFVTMSY